jgi:FkbM family methyltransferase
VKLLEKCPFTFLFRLYRAMRKRDLPVFRDIKLSYSRLGDDGASWATNLDGISKDSIVYSFGIGYNISFDLQLIKKTSCSVFAFDPTPDSINWLKNQNTPEPNFKAFPYGLADYDGEAVFYLPEAADSISSTMVFKQSKQSFNAQVKKIQTIARELGHSKIDLIKMDIEGAEYGCIENILNSGIEVNQILIEFHHRFQGFGLTNTKKMVKLLRQNGYKIFYISYLGEEYSFRKS